MTEHSQRFITFMLSQDYIQNYYLQKYIHPSFIHVSQISGQFGQLTSLCTVMLVVVLVHVVLADFDLSTRLVLSPQPQLVSAPEVLGGSRCPNRSSFSKGDRQSHCRMQTVLSPIQLSSIVVNVGLWPILYRCCISISCWICFFVCLLFL